MSLLWKISKPSIEHTSYLVGTMHIQDQRAFYLLDKIKAIIQSCEAFATEFKLDEADQNLIQAYMLLPEGTTLNDYIKPKRYKKIDAFLQENMGMPLDVFAKSKPMAISNLVTAAYFQADMPLALDATLFEFAKEEGKTLLGIETFDEQLEILNLIPIETQVKGLWNMVRKYDEFCTEMRQLAQLYQDGNIEEIYTITHKSAKGMRNIMIHNRNRNMANRIAQMIQSQSMCIAIGAAHLGGKRGVLNRLKKLKFEVEAIEVL